MAFYRKRLLHYPRIPLVAGTVLDMTELERVCPPLIGNASGPSTPGPIGNMLHRSEREGGTMRKALVLGAIVAAVVLVAGLVAGAVGARVRAPERIHVIEHATTDTEIDTDGTGGTSDSEGDLLTFHNQVYNAADTNVVGRDLGGCVLVVVGAAYDCTWTTFLPGGQIRVAGPFSFTHDTKLAITGGTGRFANARGSMELSSRAGGTEFDFIFNVEP